MEITILRKDYSKQKEFNYFFSGDYHSDSPQFDTQFCLKELEKARNRNATIFIAGDIFSLILSRDRKRYSRSSDKDERQDKVNQLIYATRDMLLPYRDLIAIIGMGNHESSFLKYHDTDATELLITLLNERRDKKLSPIVHGGYQGIIKLAYKYPGRNKAQKYEIFYNHGQGGSAEVTKGTIDFSRYTQQWITDAIWLAHKHQRIVVELPQMIGLNNSEILTVRRKIGIITGCYEKPVRQYDIKKKGYKIDFGEERMRLTQIQGGIFMRHTLHERNIETEYIF